MIDRRIIGGFYCICLPALLATYLSVRACRYLLPIYEEREQAQLKAECREVVEDLRDHPEKGAGGQRPDRPEGWKNAYTLGKGRWGYVEYDDRITVWYLNNKQMQVVDVPHPSRLPFSTLILPTLGLSLVIFWFVTIAGCWLFYLSVKERDDFIAATAHDLTTPLVALRRLIRREPEEAVRVSEQMMRLVKNLTDCLAIHSCRHRLQKETFDLRAAYDEAYALFRDDFRFLFDGKDVAVEGPARVDVVADRTKTVQILWNLLANEIKYAAPYGPVRVKFETDKSRVRVRFIDEGPGLTAAERRKIFRRYYRAKRTSQSGKGGFGIGLATAKYFAFWMDGTLTVEANEPKGCVFTLALVKG